ncbi:LysR family transcriptional regulator [Levilactobacillus enshiensis]|uniref:LysR family transcriptional regulator n=1 Tax=Levilactobacillus enshiensis TaxID=2590213 RepID=UPI00131B61E6|nr:LysR family transcriptional regulator [Levilactobacillus enshiensis]
MDIRQLTTFRTIADTLSFTQAAQLLGYTQSAVSSQIKHLEAELKAPVFAYEHRQLSLTTTGKRLLPLTEHLLSDYHAIQALSTNDTMTGTLRIAAPESLTIYRLPPILAAFRQAYPAVQLQITNATCQYNRQQLLAGEADIAFMLWPALTATDFIDHDLGSVPMTCVVSPRSATSLTGQTVANTLPFIINEPDCSYRNQFERALWHTHHQRPQLMELWSIAAIKQMVTSGVGFSYLPTMTVAAELNQHRLKAIATTIPNEIHTHVLTRKSSATQPLIQAFLELVHQHFGEVSSVTNSSQAK